MKKIILFFAIAAQISCAQSPTKPETAAETTTAAPPPTTPVADAKPAEPTTPKLEDLTTANPPKEAKKPEPPKEVAKPEPPKNEPEKPKVPEKPKKTQPSKAPPSEGLGRTTNQPINQSTNQLKNARTKGVPAGWVDITTLDPTIRTDIRYATADNFVKKKMYDCGACYFRQAMAEALVSAHKELREKGYGGLKFFDCYRPAPFQQRLWDAYPDARFVTPPKNGSMHSRGGAADLTVVDAKGKDLDMGTPFDSFSPLSYQTATNLPKEVLENRALLRETLAKYGLNHIRTEWWHYSYKVKYPVADWVWDCK